MFDFKTMADRLLLSRRDLGLDQKSLGQMATVSNTYISEIERGKAQNVGVEVIFSLAEALGVSPAYLLGLSDDPLAGEEESDEQIALIAEPGSQYLTNERVAEFIAVYANLPEDDQTYLLRIAKSLHNAETPRIIGGE